MQCIFLQCRLHGLFLLARKINFYAVVLVETFDKILKETRHDMPEAEKLKIVYKRLYFHSRQLLILILRSRGYLVQTANTETKAYTNCKLRNNSIKKSFYVAKVLFRIAEHDLQYHVFNVR